MIEQLKNKIQELKYEITKIKSEGMAQVYSLMELIEKKDKENQNKNNINTNNTTHIMFGYRTFFRHWRKIIWKIS